MWADGGTDTMSEDMRQAITGLKTEVGALNVQVGALNVQVGALNVRVGALDERMGTVESRLTTVETTVRNIAIVVTGHTEAFVRIEKQLTKLDELDGLKKSLEVFTSEIIASRNARTLTDKSFSDHQSMLTDHELRLTRIELRGKQS